jgi:hypothetical protein
MHRRLQVPRSKANPRNDASGNHDPALFRHPPGEATPPLCDAVRRDRYQSRDTVPPTLVRPTRRALEEGRTSAPRLPRTML